MTSPDIDALVNTNTAGDRAFAIAFALGYCAAKNTPLTTQMVDALVGAAVHPNTPEGRAAMTSILNEFA